MLRATAGLTGYTAQFQAEDRHLGQFRVQVGPHHHDALMRPVGLVGREQVDVGTGRRNVRQVVRAVGNAVNHGPRARRMHQVGDLPMTRRVGPAQILEQAVVRVHTGGEDQPDPVGRSRAHGATPRRPAVGR